MQPFDFDDVIDIDSTSLLLIKRGKHPTMGSCIEITQIFKGSGEVVEGGKLCLPLNQSTPTALKSLLEWAEKRIESMTPSERLNIFMEKAFDDSRTATRPLPLKREPYRTLQVSPERLQESVPNSKFNLEDLVFALQSTKPFANKVRISLPQAKVVLYYGLMGRPNMITMDVEKEMALMNIEYEYIRTGALLRELVNEGLIEMEERVGKKSNRKYYLWKFPALNSSQGK